jgi:hypothetical protein
LCPLNIEKEDVMENTTYKVNVTSPGLTIFFRNRICRTPVVFETVYKHEIDVLVLQLKQKSMKYNINENTTEKTVLEDELFDEVVKENDEVKVEELYLKEGKSSDSILDKLIAEDN